MIKTFQFFFNHEDLKPEYRKHNLYCHVWYIVDNGIPQTSSIQMVPAILYAFDLSRLRHINLSINEAVRNNYENLVNPKITTVELAEQLNNGQYE